MCAVTAYLLYQNFNESLIDRTDGERLGQSTRLVAAEAALSITNEPRPEDEVVAEDDFIQVERTGTFWHSR